LNKKGQFAPFFCVIAILINLMNPLLALPYEPALENLGSDYYDDVTAADFPQQILRFRNQDLLVQLGLDPSAVTDEDFIEAFGKFVHHPQPLLALRYHGYQFGYYNPQLGDGRGFLYGQVRGIDGELYDFGTKGSGKTPYSRGGDGMLTLKGGVREVIASEALHRMGVHTSRCFSLVETGLQLWRGDEPSPTRSSVMVRFSRSHLRFGTFERLHYLQRPDLITKLLDHTIDYYYPRVRSLPAGERYQAFYRELVDRVAKLVAQWMMAGFCHAVLNTDNMSITGESFDYGPFAFIPTYDPNFTAAYFDESGRYSYGNQPGICKLNLELLQKPLSATISIETMQEILAGFDDIYVSYYKQLMLAKLGYSGDLTSSWDNLLKLTLQLLYGTSTPYHQFFSDLARIFGQWASDPNLILTTTEFDPIVKDRSTLTQWLSQYHQILSELSGERLQVMGAQITNLNPPTVPLRPLIEAVWQPITEADNWQPFDELVARLRSGT
jgi:serine/tyrosine/threonine adenylyltransferase